MKKFGVIIVGVGPAGIASAKILKENKINYYIIDKKKFPKNQLCGGGLTNKSLTLLKDLGLDISQCKSFIADNVDVCYGSKTINVPLTNSITMIDRFEFDYNNLKQVVDDNLFEAENILNVENNILTTTKINMNSNI